MNMCISDNSRLEFIFFDSWYHIEWFDNCSAEQVLDKKSLVTYRAIQRQLGDPNTTIYRLIERLPNSQRLKIFLHDDFGTTANITDSVFGLFDGIHIYFENEGEPPAATIWTFAHELWHVIERREEEGLELSRDETTTGYLWQEDRGHRGLSSNMSFEEAFADVLGVMAGGAQITWIESGIVKYLQEESGPGYFFGFSGTLKFGMNNDYERKAFDCLISIAQSHDGALEAMARTILRHGSRMDLGAFLTFLRSDYPKAVHLIPPSCTINLL